MPRPKPGSILAVLLLAALARPAGAALGDLLYQLLPPDPSPIRDLFGQGVAIDDDVVAVAAPGPQIPSLSSCFDDLDDLGAVHLFDRATGRPLGQILPPPDIVFGGFGWRIAMADGVLLAAVPDCSDTTTTDDLPNSEIMLFDVATGQLLHRLPTATLLPGLPLSFQSPNDSIDISDGIAVVGGLRGDVGTPRFFCGYAVIIDVASGQVLHTITQGSADDFTCDTGVGFTVAIDGSNVLVSGLDESFAPTTFLYDAQTGALVREIDRFASTMDLCGNLAVIGSGVYDITTGALVVELEASFPNRVAIEGSTVVAAGETSEVTWIFWYDATSGVELGRVGVPNQVTDFFGNPILPDPVVAIDGETAVLGISRFLSEGVDVGTAYVLDSTRCDASDPLADTDGDGLLDEWECLGIPYFDGEGFQQRYELPGADPAVQDLYVEVDVLESVGLGDEVIASQVLQPVIEAFARAPGEPIVLHAAIDEPAIPGITCIDGSVEAMRLRVGEGFGLATFGSPAEREGDAETVAARLDAKAKAFRYALFAPCVDASGPATADLLGEADAVPGTTFVVSTEEPGEPDLLVISSTFMHELGHTLGLSGDHIDPNRLGVMNYMFDSMTNADGSPMALDFCREVLPTLDESALNETVPFASAAYAGARVPHFVSPDVVVEGVPCRACNAVQFADVVFSLRQGLYEGGFDATPTYHLGGSAFLEFWSAPGTGTIRPLRNDDYLFCPFEDDTSYGDCLLACVVADRGVLTAIDPCPEPDESVGRRVLTVGEAVNWDGSMTGGVPTLEPSVSVDLNYAPNAFSSAFDEAALTTLEGENEWLTVVQNLAPPPFELPAPGVAGAATVGGCGWSVALEAYLDEAFAPTNLAQLPTCRADLDDSGAVDTPDLMAVLVSWGTDGPGADIAMPGDLCDLDDLLRLLATWGQCP